MATRWARVARGLIAALVATFVAGFFHSISGGVLSLLGVTATVVLAGLVSVLVAGQTLSWVRLSTSVIASQAIFHATLGLGAPSSLASVSSTGFHDHADTFILAGGAGLQDTEFIQAAMMWPAHLGAAAITIIALRHGEAAFWMLFVLSGLAAVAAVCAWSVVAIPSSSRSLCAAARSQVPPRSLAVLSLMRHRGPPLAFA